jgi:hypothetical protein
MRFSGQAADRALYDLAPHSPCPADRCSLPLQRFAALGRVGNVREGRCPIEGHAALAAEPVAAAALAGLILLQLLPPAAAPSPRLPLDGLMGAPSDSG